MTNIWSVYGWLLIICTFHAISANCQERDTVVSYSSYPLNRISIDLLGSGIYYLVRYDKSLYLSERCRLDIGPGVSFFPFRMENLTDYKSFAGVFGINMQWRPLRSNLYFHLGSDLAYHYLYDSTLPAVFGCCSDLWLFVPKTGVECGLDKDFTLSISYTPLIPLDLHEEGDIWQADSYIHFGSLSVAKRF